MEYGCLSLSDVTRVTSFQNKKDHMLGTCRYRDITEQKYRIVKH